MYYKQTQFQSLCPVRSLNLLYQDCMKGCIPHVEDFIFSLKVVGTTLHGIHSLCIWMWTSQRLESARLFGLENDSMISWRKKIRACFEYILYFPVKNCFREVCWKLNLHCKCGVMLTQNQKKKEKRKTSKTLRHLEDKVLVKISKDGAWKWPTTRFGLYDCGTCVWNTKSYKME